MDTNNTQLPQGLLEALEEESINFIVRSKKKYAIAAEKNRMRKWGGYSIISFILLYCLTQAIGYNLIWLVGVLLCLAVLSIFVFAMIFMITKTIKQSKEKESYFVGTDTRLIRYVEGKLVIREWQKFSGHIKVDYKENELELRTLEKPKRRLKKKNQQLFVKKVVNIYSIDNIQEVLQICRNYIDKHRQNRIQ